jgi:hypothetical protein
MATNRRAVLARFRRWLGLGGGSMESVDRSPVAVSPTVDRLEERVLLSALTETWSSATPGDYVPNDNHTPQTIVTVQGDLGKWFVGDTISNSHPSTPNHATISGGKLTLHSEAQNGQGYDGVAYNIWADLSDMVNANLSIKFDAATVLSFDASGYLQPYVFEYPYNGVGDAVVSLTLINRAGQQVRYVLNHQEYAEEEDDWNRNDVFLDPDAGHFAVNVGGDFQGTSGFDPTEAESWKIVQVAFEVENTGWATLDNLSFSNSGGGGSGQLQLPGSPVKFVATKSKPVVKTTIKLRNVGDEVLRVTAVDKPSNGAFTVQKLSLPQGGLKIVPGQVLKLTVTFNSGKSKQQTLNAAVKLHTTAGVQSLMLQGVNKKAAAKPPGQGGATLGKWRTEGYFNFNDTIAGDGPRWINFLSNGKAANEANFPLRWKRSGNTITFTWDIDAAEQLWGYAIAGVSYAQRTAKINGNTISGSIKLTMILAGQIGYNVPVLWNFTGKPW